MGNWIITFKNGTVINYLPDTYSRKDAEDAAWTVYLNAKAYGQHKGLGEFTNKKDFIKSIRFEKD